MNKRPLDQLFFATFRGEYAFEDFLELDLSQAFSEVEFDGRVVYSPSKSLKRYLGFLSRVLFDRLPVEEDVVFSYRKGVNVVDAVRSHSSSKYFLQADIENFFGSISREIILDTIVKSVDFCPVSDIDKWMDRILAMVTVGGALPPGFPTSPAISNACLYGFDKKFRSWCLDNNLFYTRYADDLIVSGMEEEPCKLAISYLSKFLESEFGGCVRLNDKKTRFTRPGERVKILGVSILPNGMVSVDGRVKKNSEIAMHYLIKDREVFISFLKEDDFESAIKRFSGQLNYINTIDPVFLDKLRKKYGATVVDKVIHASVAP